MHFQILGSSSSGNSALLRTEQCKVLIDVGFSARRLEGLLARSGENLESIDAVFLTHEHNDHAIGLKGLSRFRGLRIFANHDTAMAVQRNLKRRMNWRIFETGQSFSFGNLEVTSFSIPHDAYDPVGYVFSEGGNDLFNPRRSIAWCIDLGHIPQLVREKVRGADVLVLESNHEISMLEKDNRRPWSVKQRIKSRHGHLSNTTAREFLLSEANPNWRHVFLAHLSRDCNDVSLVSKMFGREENQPFPKKFAISVVDPLAGYPAAFTF